jgi:hypothetical protein
MIQVVTTMSKVEEIERAITQLTPEDLASLRTWFAAYDAEVWDRQFAEDVQAGALDSLAEEALTDLRNGRTKDL